ncbi:MAG: formate/nitrite transporter family protein [Coriobacteriales bacterium]|nr:formate/nitrite transporter family protein [Coriobacteriales bacterium]
MSSKNSESKSAHMFALTPAEIEQKAEAIGQEKANLPALKTFILGIMAGIFIGMGGMFMLLVKSDSSLPFIVSTLLGGLVFCLGLFLVISAGAELFTGNCLMICGKLSNKYSWAKMFRNWGLVILGNLVGSLIMVAILYLCNYSSGNGAQVGNLMIQVACDKIDQPWTVLLVKGLMCNFLVCLAVWISFAARSITDKFFSILLPITAFVACGFEHSVANMFFLPMGLVTKISGFVYTGLANLDILNLGGVLYNLSAVLIGNIIGGVVFVGISYWLAFAYKKNKDKLGTNEPAATDDSN